MPTPLPVVPPPLAVVLFGGLGVLEWADVEPAVPEDDDPPPQAARTTAPAIRTKAKTRLDMGTPPVTGCTPEPSRSAGGARMIRLGGDADEHNGRSCHDDFTVPPATNAPGGP